MTKWIDNSNLRLSKCVYVYIYILVTHTHMNCDNKDQAWVLLIAFQTTGLLCSPIFAPRHGWCLIPSFSTVATRAIWGMMVALVRSHYYGTNALWSTIGSSDHRICIINGTVVPLSSAESSTNRSLEAIPIARSSYQYFCSERDWNSHESAESLDAEEKMLN